MPNNAPPGATAQNTPGNDPNVTSPPAGDPTPPAGDPTPPAGDPTPPAADPAPPTGDPTPPPADPAPPKAGDPAPPKEGDPPPPKEGEFEIKSPEDYKLPEGVPDAVRQVALDLKLNQDQLDGAFKMFNDYTAAQSTAHKMALRKMGEAHVKNWGDESGYKLTLAKQALQQNDSDGKLFDLLKKSGYDNHPVVLDFFQKLGENLREGGFLKSVTNNPSGHKTPAQRIYPNMTSKE